MAWRPKPWLGFLAGAAITALATFAITAHATLESPLWGTAWDDLRTPASFIQLPASNPPARTQWRTDGAGSDGVYVLEFEDQAVNEEQVHVDNQLPHAWAEASGIWPHVHWSLEDDTNCNVRWCLEYLIASTGGDFPANTSVTCADCPSGADADNNQLCNLSSSAISMAGHTISAIIKGRLYRNSSHANDTCNAKDALLHEYDIHFDRDRPGSRFILVK
jgi:hypothetical protein